jgi:DNA-binding CsgD family transcriptional regulator
VPLFMDRHDLPFTNRTANEVAQAHLLDLAVQAKYGVRYVTYWMNEGCVHCLVEAPDPAAALAVHREAHESLPTNIIEVNYGSVKEVFGQIREPHPGEVWEWPAIRTMLISRIANPPLLTRHLGEQGALEVFRAHERIVREAVEARGGVRTNREISGSLGCFPSAAGAIQCALAVRRSLQDESERLGWEPAVFKIGLSAGEPVSDRSEMFGAVVQLASAVCDVAASGQILVSGVVRDLCIGKGFVFTQLESQTLPGFEEPTSLFEVAGEGAATVAPPIALARRDYPDHLSAREVEVLGLIAQGRTNHEIADALVISLSTVLHHVTNILTKTGCSNRTEAAAYAHRHGLS